MKFWHTGFAVKDLEQAISLWTVMGYDVKQKFEKKEPPAIAALLEDRRGIGIELWQFTGNSPLNEFVGRHIAFQCKDARKSASLLSQKGYREVIPYTEGVMVNYIFVQDEFGTCLELTEVKEGTWVDD